MKVADVMSRTVEFVGLDATAQEAAELMGELDVGSLPAGTEHSVEGVLTDRDILYRVVARGLDPKQVRVREILSRPVLSCGEDDSLKAAMDMMAANHIRRLPVRDAVGVVTGWVTIADLARKLLVDSDSMQAELKQMTEAED